MRPQNEDAGRRSVPPSYSILAGICELFVSSADAMAGGTGTGRCRFVIGKFLNSSFRLEFWTAAGGAPIL